MSIFVVFSYMDLHFLTYLCFVFCWLNSVRCPYSQTFQLLNDTICGTEYVLLPVCLRLCTHSWTGSVCWTTVTQEWDILLGKCHSGATYPGWGTSFSGFCFFFFPSSHPHFAGELPQGTFSVRVQRSEIFWKLACQEISLFWLDRRVGYGILGITFFRRWAKTLFHWPLAFSVANEKSAASLFLIPFQRS